MYALARILDGIAGFSNSRRLPKLCPDLGSIYAMRLNEKCTIFLFSFLQDWPLLKLLAVISAAGILAVGLNSAYAELLGYSESQITVGERQVYCTQDKIEAELVVRDLGGNVITETAAGSEVSMESTLSFDCNTYDPLTMLFEVRDSDGITTYFTYQQVPAYQTEQVTTSSSWIPDKPGEYEVRFFYITCFSCLGILATVDQYKIIVY